MSRLAAEKKTGRNILSVPVRKFDSAPGRTPMDEQDLLAVEEPLQLRVGDRDLAVMMRTPGSDEELALGFLFTEGFIQHRDDIVSVEIGQNTATVTLAQGVNIEESEAQRNFYMTSSCGVCGKASIDALTSAGCTTIPRSIWNMKQSLIRTLPAKLRESQAVFDRTGGLHASGLFSYDGDLIYVREDVGRHNALDKLIGRALLDERLPLHDHVLLVSGRTSFELLQKAVMAGLPVLAAVGAPSSLAVKTALRFGVTLIGFLRDDRFNVYAGHDRIY